MSVPDWVHNAVFYQIFPDRFANGDPEIDPPNVQAWGAPPTRHGFQGGDLAGIRLKLDYLRDLGINALYLNPIFQSPNNHRYHTYDYFRIDPWLGDLSAFHTLIEAAHQREMRVILDGVFNHCSRGFFAFADLLENEAESPYLDWFHVKRFPLQAYTRGQARNYLAWWKMKPLPKFNTSNPPTRRYLLDAARYWIEHGADGWRLDVPNEIDDDDFWAEFRHLVRQTNPEAYLVGEIWEVGPRWANDTHFDGLMNYPARAALLDALTRRINATEFLGRVERLLKVYARENVYAMLNLLGSHDTERIITMLGGDARKVRLAYLFLMAYPGAPCVYYGDEIGLRGGRDPDCRRAFPWDEAQWDTGLREAIKAMIAARRASSALREGDFQAVWADDVSGTVAFARTLGAERVIVALNMSESAVKLEIPVAGVDGSVLRSLLDGMEAAVVDGKVRLELDGLSGVWLGKSA